MLNSVVLWNGCLARVLDEYVGIATIKLIRNRRIVNVPLNELKISYVKSMA